MPRIYIKGWLTEVALTRTDGMESVVFSTDRKHPSALIISSVGGHHCATVTELAQPTYDGARSVVHSAGLGVGPGGRIIDFLIDESCRVTETASEIHTVFKEAGIRTLPRVVPQGRLSKFTNVLRRTLGL